MGMRAWLWASFFVSAVAFPYRLISSAAPVRGVFLSYFATKAIAKMDPRLDLVLEVRRLFPKLPIYLAADVDEETLYKKQPKLKGVATKVFKLDANNIQDAFEFGWDADKKRYADFVFAPYGEPLFDELKKWADHFPLRVPVAEKDDPERRQSEGGNVEALPDGTPVVGVTLPKEQVEFFKKHAPKGEVLEIDTRWTEVGHVDEVFLWTGDPKGKAKCLLFAIDPEGGKALVTPENLDKLVTHEREMQARVWRVIVEEDGRTKLADDFLEKPVTDLEKHIVKLSEEAAARSRKILETELIDLGIATKAIAADRDRILKHKSMEGCRSVKVPVTLRRDTVEKTGRKFFKPVFNNQVNALVIDKHVFAYEPDFPAQKTAVESIYRENGFEVHWFGRFGSNSAAGNLHGDSNTLRDAGAR